MTDSDAGKLARAVVAYLGDPDAWLIVAGEKLSYAGRLSQEGCANRINAAAEAYTEKRVKEAVESFRERAAKYVESGDFRPQGYEQLAIAAAIRSMPIEKEEK